MISPIVNYYGKEIISYPYSNQEFESQKKELSMRSDKENELYELLRMNEKKIFQSLQKGKSPTYVDSLKPYFNIKEFDDFVNRFEIISTKHLDDKLTELSSVVTREYRIRSFDSGSKHIIRQIFKALYNDISQVENNQIVKMISDYELFLNKDNIKRITNEMSKRIQSDNNFEKRICDVLKNKISVV